MPRRDGRRSTTDPGLVTVPQLLDRSKPLQPFQDKDTPSISCDQRRAGEREGDKVGECRVCGASRCIRLKTRWNKDSASLCQHRTQTGILQKTLTVLTKRSTGNLPSLGVANRILRAVDCCSTTGIDAVTSSSLL